MERVAAGEPLRHAGAGCGGFAWEETWEETLTFIRLAGIFESCFLCVFFFKLAERWV